VSRCRGTSVADTVADLLREEVFGLQANAKTIEGSQHPNQDAQFHYLNEQAGVHRDTGQPVIGVDTEKKELIGQFKNNCCQWRPAAERVTVNVAEALARRSVGMRALAEEGSSRVRMPTRTPLTENNQPLLCHDVP
jgi:hypothetical protein